MGKMKLISELIKERDDAYIALRDFKNHNNIMREFNLDEYIHLVNTFNYSCECLENAFRVRYTHADVAEDIRSNLYKYWSGDNEVMKPWCENAIREIIDKLEEEKNNDSDHT